MWKALACGCIVLVLAFPAWAQTAPLFEESFADASAWRFPPGAFKTENGALVCTSPNAAVAALADRTFADLTLDLDLFRPPKGLVGVSIRRQKGSDAWADAYYFVSQQPQHLRVIRKVGGKYDSALFESDRLKELPANATARLRIWAKGDHFRVWIGGNLIANVRDEQPFLSGGIALHVGTGGIEPPARFGRLAILGADAVAPPKPDEIPPLGLAETLERSEAVLKTEIQEIRPRMAEAPQTGEADDDAALQRKVELVHALLWRYYFDPRTNMVYTILEPHTGQVVFPTREQVLANFPNANGWSTAIEDCAGYGLGRHLAWLVERYEVTHRPEHLADARKVLEGALLLGMIRPADASGFAELVRGVLPDGQTYYKGEGRGSSGDNYNGYSYGLWRYSRALFASKEERRRIAAALDRTCYRPYSFPAFAAIAADVTDNERWREQYAAGRKSFVRNVAGWTSASRLEAKSWTAV